MAEAPEHSISFGNIFADLGLHDADEVLTKADLAIRISGMIEERELTQADAAELLDIDQATFSALVRGRLEGFSLERLIRFLNHLGQGSDLPAVLIPCLLNNVQVLANRGTNPGRYGPGTPGIFGIGAPRAANAASI